MPNLKGPNQWGLCGSLHKCVASKPLAKLLLFCNHVRRYCCAGVLVLVIVGAYRHMHLHMEKDCDKLKVACTAFSEHSNFEKPDCIISFTARATRRALFVVFIIQVHLEEPVKSVSAK